MFSFPTRVFNCYAILLLLLMELAGKLCMSVMPFVPPLFLTGCGYINYALASVHRMHAWGNCCNYVLDLCALGLL